MIQIVTPNSVHPEQSTKKIFLAGPMSRTGGADWRDDAIKILQDGGYDGAVYDPRSNWGAETFSFSAQVEWELKALNRADVILFWVPRTEENPGFTTNVEFGKFVDSGRCVLGFPPDAMKMRYLKELANNAKAPVFETLERCLEEAIILIGAGALRKGGEQDVPLLVWKSAGFQTWLQAQVNVGNRLDSAEVLWTYRVGADKKFLLAYTLQVSVWVESEGRHKSNEFIFSRPDISCVVAYHKVGNDILDSEIVLVREFRSPVRNSIGFVMEVPGGSSFKPNMDPLVSAQRELKQETGLELSNLDRFRRVGSRQLTATLSTHQAHVWAVELSEEEMEFMKGQKGVAHGVVSETERTYVEVQTLRNICNAPDVDFSMLGMIFDAIVLI